MRSSFLVALILVSNAFSRPSQEQQDVSIAGKTKGMEQHPGFFNFYWDAKNGKLYLEIDKWNAEFLYVHSLPAGIGSNDIGLDRGQLGGERIVKFERIGPKVLLVQPNYDYRAVTSDESERKAVEEAFAQSVLWGFDVVAEQGTNVLVDATNFYLRDVHDVAGTLKRTKQGQFNLDPSRCAFYLPRTKNFPRNTEVEVTLTFTGDSPGNWVRQVVPTPAAITVREHHSFVQLPGPGYKPREFDPRAGLISMSYQDYATPISEPLVKRFVIRHRLQKKDPNAAVSDPVQPIVYYLDPGTPEPVRSALLDGAEWWNQAFEAIGYRNAFRVEMLPDSADPMDVRYNVIQWVHRATRGWSYGEALTDPRTGEIIKGQVTLGSLRVRQDYLIAQGLIADYEKGKDEDPRMLHMALARIRQLGAHEVGHTLGLEHNFLSSTQHRSSVMDYPYPLIALKEDSTFDFSNAYATGIGDWDKVAIAYAYQDFPPGIAEHDSLNEIINKATSRGLVFLTDQDARPQGSAHPQTHLWDNGVNAIDELDTIMKVRTVAIREFSEKRIRLGTPIATLEDVFVPLYLMHRYQVEAAAKVLGGLKYTYALRGDGQIPTTMIPAKEQRRALEALLSTITPKNLAVPERILSFFPPRPEGYGNTQEDFVSRTSPTFDPLAVAEVAASLVVGMILQPERDARLVEYHARYNELPGFSEVVQRLLDETWYGPHGDGYFGEIRRSVDVTVLNNLLALAMNDNASPAVRGIALLKIHRLKQWLVTRTVDDSPDGAYRTFALSLIRTFEENPKDLKLTKPPDPPAGPPIGDFDFDVEY